MDKKEKLKELTRIFKNKDKWDSSVDYVGAQLDDIDVEVKAKVLWILGEIGLKNPKKIAVYVNSVAGLLHSKEDLLRERSLNALGRIGRADFALIEPYWLDMFSLAEDNCSEVRLSFIWASENIASTYPEKYEDFMEIYSKFLDDESVRVRMESPEMFRVLGKRKPEFTLPYLEKLREMSETDSDRVVRIHSLGAIKAALNSKEK